MLMGVFALPFVGSLGVSERVRDRKPKPPLLYTAKVEYGGGGDDDDDDDDEEK